MKILYVAPYPPLKSGVADYAYHFKKAMEQNLDIQMDLLDIFQNENIYTLRKFLSLGKKVKLLNIESYDLAHFEIGNGQNREFYILCFIQKLFPNLKTIVTLHDPPQVLTAPMKFIGLENKVRIIRGVRKIFDIVVGRYWTMRVLKKVDIIITLTEKGREEIIKNFDMNQSKVKLIPHLTYISSSELSDPVIYKDKIEKIIFFGYFGSKKGIDILVKAFVLLLKSSVRYNKIKIYIAGGLPVNSKADRFYKYITRLIEQANIKDNVIFTGWIPENEKEQLLKEADIVVLPYRKQATFGASGALIQAISYGIPVIISNTKSFYSEVEDGKIGLLFEDGNVKMLADKIRLLVENQELRQQLGNNAREHILKEHSWEYVTSKMSQIYENVYEGNTL
ncbi:glycosyltransferase family 4 protein [bacterium]|nr:glycosyltransferase family 4 protein [bacterium]MBU4511043.1 glycosyltransferase family 4 protein [bacterium]